MSPTPPLRTVFATPQGSAGGRFTRAIQRSATSEQPRRPACRWRSRNGSAPLARRSSRSTLLGRLADQQRHERVIGGCEARSRTEARDRKPLDDFVTDWTVGGPMFVDRVRLARARPRRRAGAEASAGHDRRQPQDDLAQSSWFRRCSRTRSSRTGSGSLQNRHLTELDGTRRPPKRGC